MPAHTIIITVNRGAQGDSATDQQVANEVANYLQANPISTDIETYSTTANIPERKLGIVGTGENQKIYIQLP